MFIHNLVDECSQLYYIMKSFNYTIKKLFKTPIISDDIIVLFLEFRLYMYKNHNWVLEGYYGLGEKIADQKTRELDLKVWSNEGKI